MGLYAKTTMVSVERSKAEVEKTLARYGATQFMHGWNGPRAVLAFQAHGKMIRFELQLPNQDEPRFTRRRRSKDRQLAAWEQACRQQWRALSLIIKAKLEAVASGITVFEQEFMAHIVIGRQTLGETLLPQLDEFYKTGKVPPLLGYNPE